MDIEIERKFLVNEGFREHIERSYHIKQGYICKDSGRTVRVRIMDDKAFLTIKGPSINGGLARFEWEKEISLRDAESLFKLVSGGIIEKTRHIIPYKGHNFEVDEFFGDNEGLIEAEVEMAREGEEVLLPDWITIEVTGDKKYYNSCLLANPYKNWK